MSADTTPPQRPVDQTLGGRDRAIQPRQGPDHPIPLPRHEDPQPVGPGQPRLTADAVESPLRGNTHGGFGERPGETDPWQHRHRASGRLNHTGHPLYGLRRTLRTRVPLLSTRQRSRLTSAFADDRHIAVTVPWSIYQRIIAAYSQPDRRRGKTMMPRSSIPSRRSSRRAGRVGPTRPNLAAPTRRMLAYFDRHTSNGPPKPSTDAWKRYAATPSASETSPTTESDPTALRQRHRPNQCTLKPKEPANHQRAWQAPGIPSPQRRLKLLMKVSVVGHTG